MRKYVHIDLSSQAIREEEFSDDQVARAGRYFIAKTLSNLAVAKVDPLGLENPLIFLPGRLLAVIGRTRIAPAWVAKVH